MEKTKAKIIRHKKKNVRIFPIYKAVSWDLLFYFPIIFLFLTQIKGFSASQVLLADAFYTLANTFWQIPVTRLVDKVGKKNSLIIGNILYSVSIFAMIFIGRYYELLIVQFIYALGYSIKGICEPNILYDSLPSSKKRGKIFSTIDGKSSSYFYIFDAVASIIAGFTFVINGYIPMILCFICCIISTILSFRFNHTIKIEEKVEVLDFKIYIGELKESFKFFIKSRRLRCLILLNMLFWGLMFGIVNLRSSMLSEMYVPEQYFGIVFAMLQIAAAYSSRKSGEIHKKFKNKTLTYLCLPVAISCIVIGFIGKDNFSRSSLILITLLYLLQFFVKGPYINLMTRYINNFTNRDIRTKITALKNLTANLCTAIVSLLCAGLLKITSTANTFIIIGCIMTICIVLLLDYMRDKVGLRPEQYKKEDLKFSVK
jgi:MFS family permease